MLSDKEYVIHSLETNLFFLRIVKEHLIFAAASLPPRDRRITAQLVSIKNSTELLLSETIELADRAVRQEVLASDELVTDYTLDAERATQFLTGIPINTDLTRRELELRGLKKGRSIEGLQRNISVLNRKAIAMTKAAIAFKRKLLKNISECRAFSYTYPTMLEHVIEEAEYYVMLLDKLEKRDALDSMKEIIQQEINWNHIMGEHSKFIRGYLDPEEEKLFRTADAFVMEFDRLMKKIEKAAGCPELLEEVTEESLKIVIELRNFKEQGVEGILDCSIKSIILPLLADHVLREANHYIRLLKSFEEKL